MIGEYPKFDAGDSAVEMSLMLDRPGTVYYVVAPMGLVSTVGTDNKDYGQLANWQDLPQSGAINEDDPPELAAPDYLNIVNAKTSYTNDKIKYGSVTCGSSSVTVELVEGLDKLTNYTVYLVTQGTAQTYSDVLAYRFTTENVDKPKITLKNYSPSVNFQYGLHVRAGLRSDRQQRDPG